ncbi:MAG: CDP-alcohol phosphatidyltransferase family protein [Candidatus Aenigmatarchaeota archaeon]
MEEITKYLKPADALTVMNALSGMAAIVYFSHGNMLNGILAMLAATFFDAIDGKVARMMGGGTPFGKALDFADLISFGAAPAFLISISTNNYFGYAVAAIFLTASLLRLARFNVTNTPFFIGMPTTLNGVIFPAVFFLQKLLGFTGYAYLAAALVSSALMLGSFRLGFKSAK